MHEQKSFSSTYIWQTLQEQARQQAKNEPILASFLFSTILNHHSLASALSFHLANKLGCPTASALMIREVIEQAISADPSIVEAAYADLNAIDKRDSACCSLLTPMLFYKGFHALQCYRIAHFCGNRSAKVWRCCYRTGSRWYSVSTFTPQLKLVAALCSTMPLVLLSVKPR